MLFYFLSNFNASVLQNDHLNGLLIGHKHFLLNKFLKGDQIPKCLYIWKLYRILIFHPILMVFIHELIVMSAFRKMLWISSISYGFGDALNWKGTTKANFKTWTFLFYIQFQLQNDNLYGLLMDHNKILLFYFIKEFKKGPNSEI